jgi:pyruvate dehydrogenase E1 component alpha subunit
LQKRLIGTGQITKRINLLETDNMITNHTKESLINFELKVCESFKNKEILAPVHLYSGNENEMIDIFKDIRREDWVFCSWRSHYQCLLKGVPEYILLEEIKRGKSISLNFKEYNIFSSAIVTGIIPIANGVALANKLKNNNQHVYCFIGDMTAETGCFSENYKYSLNYDLPITWVIEDNNKSVCTDTLKTWSHDTSSYAPKFGIDLYKIIYYKYESIYPHAGTGERIQF